MTKILFILFSLFIGVSVFSQTPKKEPYRFPRYIFIGTGDTVAALSDVRAGGGGGGGGGVTAANLPLRISGVTVSADTSVAFAVALSTVQRLYKLRDSILGILPTSYIQNQFSGAQSSSSLWISSNARVDGELRINTTDLGAYGFQMDQKDAIIYGATSDGSTNILELKAANSGDRFKFKSDGLFLLGYSTAPSVMTSPVFYTGRTMIGNDDATAVWQSRYNSGTPYAIHYAVQSASTTGSAGHQFISHESGTERLGFQQEANGQVKIPIGMFVGATTTPTSTLQVGGSLSLKYTSTAIGITLDETHQTVEVTATGQTITLPTAASITGRIYTIKLTASGSCTVATTSSQNIDASTTYSLASQYKYVTVMSNGSNWIVIANN